MKTRLIKIIEEIQSDRNVEGYLDKFLTEKEVAELLGIRPSYSVRDLNLPVYSFSTRLHRYKKSDVIQLCENAKLNEHPYITSAKNLAEKKQQSVEFYKKLNNGNFLLTFK